MDKQTLTLSAEGPGENGKTAQFRDVIQWAGDGHKRLTSDVHKEGRFWFQFVESEYRREE